MFYIRPIYTLFFELNRITTINDYVRTGGYGAQVTGGLSLFEALKGRRIMTH